MFKKLKVLIVLGACLFLSSCTQVQDKPITWKSDAIGIAIYKNGAYHKTFMNDVGEFQYCIVEGGLYVRYVEEKYVHYYSNGFEYEITYDLFEMEELE